MKIRYKGLIVFLILLGLPGGVSSAAAPQEPFEIAGIATPATEIDRLVEEALRAKGITPALPCSDAVFIRRVYIDLTGRLPEAPEVVKFLADHSPGKRQALIDQLLASEAFADYWAMKWCDVLRVKAEFPINLWPNAVQAYHHWIWGAMRQNMPYDKFARALLTSSGSNFRVAPVNFYRGIQGREPSAIAGAVALTFMGTRLEGWPAERREGFSAFFSRIAFKGTAEWKEEIVHLDPASTTVLAAVFPDGRATQIAAGRDPRVVFADWLIAPQNPWFARNAVNRVWAWLLGRGIIHETDDIREDNPPANPALLAYLESELVKSNYDLRHLYRLILNSQTYQRSSIPQSVREDAGPLFAFYQVRRLEAEVLLDALCQISGTEERYESPIPEPFTFLPEGTRAVTIADGSISSQFLEMFGRPNRDTGLESERNNLPSDAQRLHLLNSSHVQRKIERGPGLASLAGKAKGNRQELIRSIYLTILSREPTEAELASVAAYGRQKATTPNQVVNDLAWALVNSKEFLYRH